MKRYILFLSLLSLVLVACDTHSPYITTGCDLTFSTTEIKGTQVAWNVEPEDDRAFYFADLMPRADYDSMKLTDEHFMTIVLDSLYRDYLDWRAQYLWTNEEYIADFRSHSFRYGKSHYFDIALRPNTEYLLYAFCINPDDIQQPVGKLYTQTIRTTDVDTTRSQVVIDFSIGMYDQPYPYQGGMTEMLVAIRPSINGHPTQEPYIYSIVSEQTLQNKYSDHHLLRFAIEEVDFIQKIIYQYPKDAHSWLNTDIKAIPLGVGFEEGDVYYILAAAYNISWPKALYTRRFEFHRGMVMDYDHDPITDYYKDYLEIVNKNK